MAHTAQDVIQAIRSFRFHYSNEKDLQAGIAKAFTEKGIRFKREVAIGASERIDFMVPRGIGIEVKIKGGPSDVARQLLGYAVCKKVKELILVTGKVRLGRLPKMLLFKNLHVVSLWGTFL